MRQMLPHATIVVDHVHLIRLANEMVTTVRRRVTWDQRERRGRKVDPEWANRRRLLAARDRLSDKGFTTMWNAAAGGDPTGHILGAYIAKQHLRDLLKLAGTGAARSDLRNARWRLVACCALLSAYDLTCRSPYDLVCRSVSAS